MSQTLDKAGVTELVFAAVDEVNQQLRKAQRLEKSPDTVLSGTAAKLDSLGLLNLIVQVEQQVEQRCQVSLQLMDDAAMALEPSPFSTLGTLIAHLQSVLEKKPHG